MVGATIGPYQVLAKLGAGGMGEVYRARDTRLKRDVALKVLPDALAADPERVARFQREAEILAQLTHPHIAALYGLEEVRPASGESALARALVMELVEGQTLAARLAGGPVPVEEALALARQMVDALDYAHEQGVLHRDLKPANITVTPDGQLKLLDFGLAKAMDPVVGSGESGAGRGVAESPTITSPALTVRGVILGTAAYMAPEQVRGRAVDKRADIWAFGCVLYELLSGARTFVGETVSDTLAAVLKTDPDWTRLPADVPPAVRRLLTHCLQRDPKARLRDIADARLLLMDAPPQPLRVQRPARGGLVIGLAVGAVAAAGLVSAGWYLLRPASSGGPAPVRRVTLELPAVPPGSTSPTGPALALSRDGNLVAFIGTGDGRNRLFIHHLSDATTTIVRGPEQAVTPVFSPDSRWVAFSANAGSAGAIWRAPVDGGQAELLCTGTRQPRGGAWSEDGRVIFGSTAGLYEVGEPGGPCRVALPFEGNHEVQFLWPQFLPGGRGILLTVLSTSDDADSASIVVVPAGTTERRVIVRGARAGRLTASGHLVFARGNQILAVPFDLDRLTPRADPVVVLDGVASGQLNLPLIGLSDSGDLVYAPGQDAGNRIVWVTRDGARVDSGLPRRSYQPEPTLSPDGRRLALPIGTADHFLWVVALDTGAQTRVLARDAHGPIWSPDGRKVAYPVIGAGVMVKDLETAGEPEIVREEPDVRGLFAWSLDGTTILFSRLAATGAFELVALRLPDGTTQTLLSADDGAFGARFSPDGRWLAFASAESGRREVYVTDYPAARLRRLVSTDGGFAPAWAAGGREIFFLSGTSMMAAAVRTGAGMTFDRPVRLFDGIEVLGSNTPYAVAPDGRFLMLETAAASGARHGQFTMVLNWFEELQRRVPARAIAEWR